jgi:MSHA biogenesis protein MshQ
MKFTKNLLMIPILSLVSVAQASEPLLDSSLSSKSVYSGAAIVVGAVSTVGGSLQSAAALTIGANSIVRGDAQAGTALTVGAVAIVDGNVTARGAGTIEADAMVGGNFTTGDAATIGATITSGNIMVGGDVTSGATIVVGGQSVITGNVRSGASSPINLGAGVEISRDVWAGSTLNMGALSHIGGSAAAKSASIVLGALASIQHNAWAGSTITAPVANTNIHGDQYAFHTFSANEIPKINGKAPIVNKVAALSRVRLALNNMPVPSANELATTLNVNTTFTPGVYSALSMTTTAGLVITLDGVDNSIPVFWVFNINNSITFGADTTIVATNVHPDSRIIWNTAGYLSVGAGSAIMGTTFAGTSAITGGGTYLKGIGETCGGIFTITGTVTIGAGNTIGYTGCKPRTAPAKNFIIIDDALSTGGVVAGFSAPYRPAKVILLR